MDPIELPMRFWESSRTNQSIECEHGLFLVLGLKNTLAFLGPLVSIESVRNNLIRTFVCTSLHRHRYRLKIHNSASKLVYVDMVFTRDGIKTGLSLCKIRLASVNRKSSGNKSCDSVVSSNPFVSSFLIGFSYHYQTEIIELYKPGDH